MWSLSYKHIHVSISLGKFCIVYLLLSLSFKPLKLVLFLKPSHSWYWEFLGIYVNFRVFKLSQILNSQNFPRIPSFLSVGSLYSWEFLGIPKNSKSSLNWSLPFPKAPSNSKLFKSELTWIVGNFWEFLGIPRKLGIQLARDISSFL